MTIKLQLRNSALMQRNIWWIGVVNKLHGNRFRPVRSPGDFKEYTYRNERMAIAYTGIDVPRACRAAGMV